MRFGIKKGQTLLELILAIAITAIVLPVIFSILIYGFRTHSACSNYISQQDKVTDVIQRIRKDVEEAKTVTVSAIGNSITFVLADKSSTPETWGFSDGALKLNGSIAVDLLDTSAADGSSFSQSTDGNRLILKILPEHTNTDISRESNVWEPIITEFSIRYKK